MKNFIALILAAAMILGMTACGGSDESAAASVDLNAIYTEYQNTLPEMMVLDENTMLNFLGIQAADCTQVVAAVCANGLRTDEVWLIEAKDEAALERIAKLADTRLAAKADETISYSPDQYAVVEKAVVITNGLYLAVLVSPDVDTLKTTFEAAFN